MKSVIHKKEALDVSMFTKRNNMTVYIWTVEIVCLRT
jgi:hypothetical protein